MTISLSESARLLNQFQDRIDLLNNRINHQMLMSLNAQQHMREAIIQRDELTNTMRVILQETQQ
jgi:hypothetical protein